MHRHRKRFYALHTTDSVLTFAQGFCLDSRGPFLALQQQSTFAILTIMHRYNLLISKVVEIELK